jgi:hypothetical protein
MTMRRGRDARRERRRLAEVAPEPMTRVRVARVQPREYLERQIRASVVDQDDLAWYLRADSTEVNSRCSSSRLALRCRQE